MHIVYRYKLPIANRTLAPRPGAVQPLAPVSRRQQSLKEAWGQRSTCFSAGRLAAPRLTVTHQHTCGPIETIESPFHWGRSEGTHRVFEARTQQLGANGTHIRLVQPNMGSSLATDAWPSDYSDRGVRSVDLPPVSSLGLPIPSRFLLYSTQLSVPAPRRWPARLSRKQLRKT